ncbi:hypothetical protein LDL36_20950 [Komagataeibacter sp. FNDCR1]|uniref:Uncharacterized protein n=1 Tax=Acetobacter malorum TaxID=178901 RepID=A0A149UQ64_9PROT|nr:hypothetical protein [Acetobacter malorum]KXV69933.1 hypothetical protein AD951_04455 [Acetobacter malorum]MCE2580874.1 hypothetical protein [Komagataeibacter sp. FNDCR1]
MTDGLTTGPGFSHEGLSAALNAMKGQAHAITRHGEGVIDYPALNAAQGQMMIYSRECHAITKLALRNGLPIPEMSLDFVTAYFAGPDAEANIRALRGKR